VFPDGLSRTAFFSERLRGEGGSSSSTPPGRRDFVSRPGGKSFSWPIDEDTFFDACAAHVGVRNPFNFTGAGRWLEGSDWSNGWPFAGYDATQYNHVAPPNWTAIDCSGVSAIADTPGEHAIATARSDHPGVVHVAYGDGHVGPVADDVALHVWRQLGTRNGEEPTDDID